MGKWNEKMLNNFSSKINNRCKIKVVRKKNKKYKKIKKNKQKLKNIY